MKNQAELMMVLTVFAAQMLETKLGTLRLFNILENFFDPIDATLDETKNKVIKKYRSINMDKVIPGQGPGQSIVEVSDQPANKNEIQNRVNRIKLDTGKPTTITILNPDLVKSINYAYFVSVLPKPKKNSDLTKVLFNEMLVQAKNNFPGATNDDYLSERFAIVWGEDPTKMFKKGQAATPPGGNPGTPGPKQNGARGKMINKNMMKAGQAPRPTVNVAGQ